MSLSETISTQKSEDTIKLSGGDELIVKLNQLNENINKLQISVNAMRADIDKMKAQQMEKISRSVFAELENRVNMHSKGLETFSKKLCELHSNVTAMASQPISFQIIDGIQKHLEEIILREVASIIETNTEHLKKIIEEKNQETRSIVNRTKTFMFTK